MTFLVAVVTSSVAIKTSPILYESSTTTSYNKGIINDAVLFNMDNDYNILTAVSDKIKTKISNIENSSKNNSNDDSKNKRNTTNKKKSVLSKTKYRSKNKCYF